MAAGILFDLDGVLLHSRPVWRALISRLCADLGYPAPDDAAFDAMWGQGVQADVRTLFVRHTVPEISALYSTHFLDHADQLVVDPEAVPLLTRLAERGLAIAIVTNTPHPLAGDLVDRAGLVVDTVVGGTDTPRGKPAPDPIFEACRRLALTTDAVWMVGDTTADRDAARAAGVPFVGFGGIAGDRTTSSLAEIEAWVVPPP